MTPYQEPTMPAEPKLLKCPRCRGTQKYHEKPCAMCKGTGAVVARPLFTSAAHVAERAITVDGRTIQRCCICGFKLFDDYGIHSLDKRGKPTLPMTWQPGDYVRLPIEGPMTRDINGKPLLVGHWNTDHIPPDFCIDMVE